jgi:hypothetical protein
VDSQEVLGDTSGSNANPYLLVYVRKGATGIRTYTRTVEDSASAEVTADNQQLQAASIEMDVDPSIMSITEPAAADHPIDELVSTNHATTDTIANAT